LLAVSLQHPTIELGRYIGVIMGYRSHIGLVRRASVAAFVAVLSALSVSASVQAEVSDSDLKTALLSGTQIKGSGCHASAGVTGYLEVATGPNVWVRVNDILGWYRFPGCTSATPFGPWTIGVVPKGAILRWTVTNPSWGRSFSSNPLETYAGPDPIPLSGFFELKKGCYQPGYSAVLQYRVGDGSWSFVADAFGWSAASDCPSGSVRPWAVTLMTLQPGTQYRWNIYFPGGFTDVYTETETIPYPTTTTTTFTTTTTSTTIARVTRVSEKVIVCASKTQKLRVVGRNPKCPTGYRKLA